MRVCFFDRDGTIIHDYPDQQWTFIDQPVFVDGSIPAMKYLVHQGYEIIIITNQYLINEGYITQKQYDMVNMKMLSELASQDIHVLDVFYCPHGRNDGCHCIKPNTGMVEKALAKYPDINLSESFVVGDSIVDMELANKLGIRGFGINVTLNSVQIQTIESVAQLPQFI